MKKFKRLLSVLLVCCLAMMVFPISASAASVTEKESNDSISTAQSISLGNNISGSISERGDDDFYKFSITNSGKVSMNVTSYMEYYSVILYDASGNRLWYDASNNWNSSVGFRSDDYDLYLEIGTYYLEVRGSYSYNGSSSYTGTYTISTSFTSANATESEPNNSVANANSVTLGNTIRGVIAENGDYDFYKFTLSKSGDVPMTVTAYMDYYSVIIYDASGNRIWYDDYNKRNSTTGYREDEYTITLDSGTYYLEMRGSSSYSGSSSYPGTYVIGLGTTSAVSVTGISLNQSTVALKPGGTATLTATVTPSDAKDKSVSWSSSKTSVATVSSSGVVTAKAEGTTTITAKTSDGGYTATCTVTVTKNTTGTSFNDVSPSSWYYDAVQWAVKKQITSGTSSATFSPNDSCTRAQAVTFLWRAAGSPNVSGSNPFTDVSSSDYYYKAVLWAVKNGITSGTSSNKFSPNSVCQRSQIVTFLYRYAGEPSVSGKNSFKDVSSSSFYYKAVLWAVKNDVTSGTGNGQFSPSSTCTRAQIVTFLYRYMAG
jgi:uncharacterized protein YjdB